MGVPLSAFWVYDYAEQADRNVALTNDRGYMIDLVAHTNALRANTEQGR
jgi:hypothetical protein